MKGRGILKITVLDTFTADELKLLVKTISERFQEKADFAMVGLINKRLIPVVLKEAGVNDLKRPAASLSDGELERIARILTDWRFRIRGTKGWQSAQVTAGSVSTDEIDRVQWNQAGEGPILCR